MEQKPLAKIDFKKYRSDELYASVAGLINVRNLFFNSIFYVGVAATGVAVIGGVLFWFRGSFLTWSLIEGYCTFFGVVVGVLFAIAQVIRHSIGNMLKIIEMMIVVTQQVARDAESVNAGDTRLPTATELVQGVYHDIFSPIIEHAIKDQFRILSRPILFVYKLTFARVVKRVIGGGPSESVDMNHAADEARQKVAAAEQSLADQDSTIIKTLSWTHGKIEGVGGWIKFLIMMPCYFFCVVIALVAMIPLIVAWFLTGKTPDPEEAEAAFRLTEFFCVSLQNRLN